MAAMENAASRMANFDFLNELSINLPGMLPKRAATSAQQSGIRATIASLCYERMMDGLKSVDLTQMRRGSVWVSWRA